VKQLLVVGLLIVAVALAVDELGDLTQSRPDHVAADSRSEVVVEIDAANYAGGENAAATALVAACSGSVADRVIDATDVVGLGSGRYRFAVTPALGRHSEVKLVGCLQDLTIDHVQAEVVSVASD
jgi:hypothetical protein